MPVSSRLDSKSLDGADPPRGTLGDVQPALRAWTALARCYSTIVRATTKDIARYDLSLPQFAVLEILYHKGPLPLGQIGSLLLVTGGNITYVVDELEARGLARRER